MAPGRRAHLPVQGRRSLYGTGGTCPPNILEAMLFRMSARVTATVVCCIIMQILCVVSQKLQLLGDFRPTDLQSSFMPPNNPVRSTPLSPSLWSADCGGDVS